MTALRITWQYRNSLLHQPLMSSQFRLRFWLLATAMLTAIAMSAIQTRALESECERRVNLFIQIRVS